MADIATLLSCGGTQDSAWDELYKKYIEDRMIVLNGEIDVNTIEDIIMWVLWWNKEDQDIPVEKRKKIRLFISSPGGNAFNGNILADVLLHSKTPIMGIALDICASAAYICYLGCHERISWPSTALLQHEGEISIENSRSKAKQTSEFLDRVSEREKEFILSRTSFSSEEYDDLYETELWMDAHKAKELGIVHKIIGEDCDLDYIL